MTATLRIGDARDLIRDVPDGSVDLLVTSPPFLAQRSYLADDHPNKAREMGSEADPAAFIGALLELTAEWRRVLAPHGSICVELGDTYSGSGGAGGDYNQGGLRDGQRKFKSQRKSGWPLAKSLCGIPHAYELSLIYGWNVLDRHGPDSPAGRWRARNYIAWGRPNPSVGSLGKRNVVTATGDSKFRPATSYITVACCGRDRYFDLDAVRIESSPNTHARIAKNGTPRHDLPSQQRDGGNWNTLAANNDANPAGAPPLDWHSDMPGMPDEDGDWLWRLSTTPYAGAHYAVYPEALPKRLIEAMCPQRVCRECGRPSERIANVAPSPHTGAPGVAERRKGNKAGVAATGYRHGDTSRQVTTLGWTDCGHDDYRNGLVLDPFAGSGTTLAVAVGLGRDAIGFDLDARNEHLIRERCGMFLEVS